MAHARLEVLDPTNGTVAEAFPIDADRVTIGRGVDAEIGIADAGMSRLHAMIVRSDAGYIVAEIKTQNGIWIDGKRVAQCTLVDGSRFRLGNTWFQIRIDPRAAATMYVPGNAAPPPPPVPSSQPPPAAKPYMPVPLGAASAPASAPPSPREETPQRHQSRRAETAPVDYENAPSAPPATPVNRAKPANTAAPSGPKKRGWGSVIVVGLVLGLLVGGGAFAYMRAKKRGGVPWQAAEPYNPFAALPEIQCPGGACAAVDLVVGGRLVAPRSGGTDQVELIVPPRSGASGTQASIRIEAAPALDVQKSPTPGAAGLRVAGPAIKLEPSGQRFERPVLLRVPYDPAVPVNELAAVVLSVGPDGKEVWERQEVYVDRAAGMVTIELYHFTVVQTIRDGARWAWSGAKEIANDMKEGVVGKAESAWGLTKDGIKGFRHTYPDRTSIFLSEHCRRARALLGGGGADASLKVVSDESVFWKALNFNVPGHRAHAFANYLVMEDGVTKPIRSGREVDLYNRIKQWVATSGPDKRLTTEDVLRLALRAVEVDGTSNLQLAMLTAQNVIRLMARPQQWTGAKMPEDYGHPRTDEATPIFDDLLGKGSSGGESMLDILKKQGRVSHGGDDWSTSLFSPGADPKSPGIFETLPNASNASYNGGSHYYFWVGATTTVIVGPGAAGVGIEREKTTKAELGEAERGQIQGGNGYLGAELGLCLEAQVAGQFDDLAADEKRVSDTAMREWETKDQPCPPRKRAFTKCPWSPDGYEVKECDVGFCYDAGFGHTLACKPTQAPAFAWRNDMENLVCPSGYEMVSERCSGVPVGCRPYTPPPPVK